MDDVATYLELARRYRQLAQETTTDQSRGTLLYLAHHFDAKAHALEARKK